MPCWESDFLRAFIKEMCYALMNGEAPRPSHFRAFGCRCFSYKKCRLDNFEKRSSNGIFLGYEGPIRRPEMGGVNGS
jgi:hypothetical protein